MSTSPTALCHYKVLQHSSLTYIFAFHGSWALYRFLGTFLLHKIPVQLNCFCFPNFPFFCVFWEICRFRVLVMQAKEQGVLWWWGWEGALYSYNTRYGPEWALYLYSIYIDSTSTYITRGMDESGRTCCHLFNSTTLRPACAALIRNKMKSKYGRDFICSQKLKPFSQVIPGGACPGNDWITDKLLMGAWVLESLIFSHTSSSVLISVKLGRVLSF